MSFRQNKSLLVTSILLAGIMGFIIWISYGPVQVPPIQNAPPNAPIVSSTPIIQANGTTELKTYRNTDFGFEFQYPQNGIILENSFGSYYSKFNIVASPSMGEYDPPPFLVNIVLPEYADHAFLGMGATTSTVTVAGLSGLEYKYEFEGSLETSIILPLGKYKVILGTRKPYELFFSQIISTLHFFPASSTLDEVTTSTAN